MPLPKPLYRCEKPALAGIRFANFSSEVTPLTAETVSCDHPVLLANIAFLLTPLLYKVKDTGPDIVALLQAVRDAIDHLARRWLAGIQHQLLPLRKTLALIQTWLERIAIRSGRIILPELPIGNSVPTKLLVRILQDAGFEVIVTRVSLSRNDATKRGLTREDLLRDGLASLKPTTRDLVVYLEEWVSGSAFFKVSQALDRILKGNGGYLLPVAMLAEGASAAPRFASFARDHDALARKLGLVGHDYRIQFPAFEPTVGDTPEFFWSENDRLAGYRKTQLFGSLFSSIVGVASDIHNDEETPTIAWNVCLESAARRGDRAVFATMARDFSGFRRMVAGLYIDFLEWKSQAEKMNFASNTGVVPDLIVGYAEVSAAIEQSLYGRPAKALVEIAILFMKEFEANPRNQYFFKSHVPVITDLEPDLRAFHDAFFSRLVAAVVR